MEISWGIVATTSLEGFTLVFHYVAHGYHRAHGFEPAGLYKLKANCLFFVSSKFRIMESVCDKPQAARTKGPKIRVVGAIRVDNHKQVVLNVEVKPSRLL